MEGETLVKSQVRKMIKSATYILLHRKTMLYNKPRVTSCLTLQLAFLVFIL